MAIGAFETNKERLSALADGELDAAGLVAACADWSSDPAARADWHAWHLIGDVLRSDDLASDAGRDRRLCAAVRLRLQSEPVVLAPTPSRAVAAAGVANRLTAPGRWRTGAAVAAGFVLVAGTFALIRPGDAPAPVVASAAGPARVSADPAAAVPAGDVAAPAVAIVADSKVIRDAQLDRYLEAHKQFAGTSALGVPSAFLRSATVDSASR
jgi:sigma-E factor negative regulatory protein RseA